jgi:hypothetical protein
MPKRTRIDAIEALIQRDVGRGANALFAAARGGLWSAASALSRSASPRVGILTGFYVPHGDPPAAETDGPAAAALLAHGLAGIGATCRVLTDAPCASACAAALVGAGLPADIDIVHIGAPLAPTIAAWRQHGLDWVVSIERCGPGADGKQRNMRGEDIGGHAARLDQLFVAGPWRTIAIGDGGNEIGMGSVRHDAIAGSVPFGEQIACVTQADHLIAAGVSHWGVYGLLGALAALRTDWRPALLKSLDPVLDAAILVATVTHGPAVDGVSLRRAFTIDTIEMAAHHGLIGEIRAALD